MHTLSRHIRSGAWLLAAALACTPGDRADAPASVDTLRPGPVVTATVTDSADAAGIRADGIGRIRAGMTIGDLRAALPPGESLEEPGPYMVDIDAMPVVRGGDTLYAILIVSGESSADNAAINLAVTTDTTFRTAEGIGPGSTLAAAAAVYGAPTLAYSTNDESREYATFPDAPPRLRFRVAPAGDDAAFAGTYDTAGEYVQTTRYDPEARITMVMLTAR